MIGQESVSWRTTATLRQEYVTLPGGLRLAVLTSPGPRRPFLLVHGLASNARLWDGIAWYLLLAGHEAISVDLRGHGRSAVPPDGYDTATCADDLAALVSALELTGWRTPVVVGHSWGGNIAISLAARHPGSVAGVVGIDGGWIHLAHRFLSFEDCWSALAPPRFDGLRFVDLAARIRATLTTWPPGVTEAMLANLVELADGGVDTRLSRDHHRQILQALWSEDLRPLYRRVTVPVLLCPTGDPHLPLDRADAREAANLTGVAEAIATLPDSRVRWYPGAHDLHAQHPARVAGDLLAFADRLPAPMEV